MFWIHRNVTLWFKTTVLQIFFGARTIDKDRQHSSSRQTTTYRLIFFIDFFGKASGCYCSLWFKLGISRGGFWPSLFNIVVRRLNLLCF
jgi:hypothetical protein